MYFLLLITQKLSVSLNEKFCYLNENFLRESNPERFQFLNLCVDFAIFSKGKRKSNKFIRYWIVGSWNKLWKLGGIGGETVGQ